MRPILMVGGNDPTWASEKTVRNHVSTILVKLQVLDRAAAVAKARDAGLGSSSQRQVDPDQFGSQQDPRA